MENMMTETQKNLTMPIYRDRVTQIEPIVDDTEELKLKKTVFLGYTDVAAGGIRALLGINMKKEYHDLHIPELAGSHVACVNLGPLDPRDKQYSLVQVWNLKYEQFSVIVINSVISADKCHYVCSKIMDLCTDSCVDKLVVLSALRVEIPSTEIHDIYENTVNDIPLTSCPPLPEAARINDTFLSTLIQMVQVENVPTCFLLIPAHRACLGQAREEDGSAQAISTFQTTIDRVMKISFDREFSLNLVYKGEDEKNTGTVSMMYS